MRGFFIAPQRNKYYRCLCGLIACILSFSLVFSPTAGYAQSLPAGQAGIHSLNLPIPGTMVGPSPVFAPVLLKGMTIYPEDPLKFDFIIDIGHSGLNVGARHALPLREETEKLIKYFLASMTVPKDDLWVNLSPYEDDRIIPEELGKTELGRDMLAQDYILKQLTASLMYPEEELGKKFWDRIYERAEKEFGTSEVPVNTFNKVWILPESATVYEHGQTVYIVDARLKVMLDSDYMAMEHHSVGTRHAVPVQDDKNSLELSESIIRQIILPEIEREVNEGTHFAPLRQIYHSLILAKWYKEMVKNSVGARHAVPLLEQIYIDQNKIAGVDVDDKTVKDKIYEQYMEAYKKGVFNYIKEDYVAMDFQQQSTATPYTSAEGDPIGQKIIPRKYFSGGLRIGAGDIKRSSSPVRDSENPQYTVRVEIASQKEGKQTWLKEFLRRRKRVNRLFGFYENVFKNDIRFSGAELEKLLMPVSSGNRNMIQVADSKRKQEDYLEKAYTEQGLWDADRDSGVLWDAVREDLKKQGYSDRVIRNDWKKSGMDVFGMWMELANLSDNDFSILKAKVSKQSRGWKKKEIVGKAMGKSIQMDEILELERGLGQWLIDNDYSPPVSKIVQTVDISESRRLDRDKEIIPFARKVHSWAGHNMARYELMAHRVPTLAILLNIVFSMRLGKTDLAKLNAAYFLSEFVYGDYIIAFLKDQRNPEEETDYYFLVPDDVRRSRCETALTEAVRAGILTNDERKDILEKIYTYNAFIQYLEKIGTTPKTAYDFPSSPSTPLGTSSVELQNRDDINGASSPVRSLDEAQIDRLVVKLLDEDAAVRNEAANILKELSDGQMIGLLRRIKRDPQKFGVLGEMFGKSGEVSLEVLKDSGLELPGILQEDWFNGKGHPSSLFHDFPHSQDVAAVAYILARATGLDDARASFLYLVGLLHDFDPERVPNTPSRVPATLRRVTEDFHEIRSLSGERKTSVSKEYFGWGEREYLMAMAIIQRTEFPFSEGHSDPAYEEMSPVARYEQLLVQLRRIDPAAAQFVVEHAPALSEYADKSNRFLIGGFSYGVDRLEALIEETNGSGDGRPSLLKTFLIDDQHAFTSSLGDPKNFAFDRKIALRLGLDDVTFLGLSQALEKLPASFALRFRANARAFKTLHERYDPARDNFAEAVTSALMDYLSVVETGNNPEFAPADFSYPSSAPVENQEKFAKWKDVDGVEILRGGNDGIGSDDAEMLALIDGNGELTGEEASKIEVHRSGLWHMTAHIYIFDEAGRLLLQKRSLKKKSSGGSLQVAVSGHVNAGEGPHAGVFREGEEEIGIPIDPKRLTRVTKINEIKRSYPTEEGVNNEFTTVYKYIATDEELRQVERNYNTNENDEFWLIPADIFEMMIEEDPQLFSRSLNYIVRQDGEIYRRIKDPDRSAGVKSETSVTRSAHDREVLGFIGFLKLLNDRMEREVELLSSDFSEERLAQINDVAKELKSSFRRIDRADSISQSIKNAISDVLGNGIVSAVIPIELGLEKEDIPDLRQRFIDYQNELKNLELIVENGELLNIEKYWAPSHFVNLDQLPEKAFSSSPVLHEKVGGIDFNEIGVERQGSGMEIRFDPVEVREIIDMGIDGFAPVIIHITPLPSILPLLGLEPRKDEELEISRK